MRLSLSLTGLLFACATATAIASTSPIEDNSSSLMKRTGGYQYCSNSNQVLVFKNGQCQCNPSKPSGWSLCKGPTTAGSGQAVCNAGGCNIICNGSNSVIKWVTYCISSVCLSFALFIFVPSSCGTCTRQTLLPLATYTQLNPTNFLIPLHATLTDSLCPQLGTTTANAKPVSLARTVNVFQHAANMNPTILEQVNAHASHHVHETNAITISVNHRVAKMKNIRMVNANVFRILKNLVVNVKSNAIFNNIKLERIQRSANVRMALNSIQMENAKPYVLVKMNSIRMGSANAQKDSPRRMVAVKLFALGRMRSSRMGDASVKAALLEVMMASARYLNA